MNKIEEFNEFTEKSEVCNISVFSNEQRKEHSEMTVKIFTSVSKLEENDNGYTFYVSLKDIPYEEISEWVSLESKCCGFMKFDLKNEKSLSVLKISGDEKTKEFLENSPLVELTKS